MWIKAGREPIKNQLLIAPEATSAPGYFSAYQAILMSAYAAARVLAEGLEDAGKLLRRDSAKGLLKAVLPHQSEWIETNDPSAYNLLLDDIKDLLLLELRKTLEGQETDRDAVEQGARIAEQLRKMQKAQAEENAALAKVKAERT